MVAYGILKVIYAPHKVFKEIVQNPKYIVPILVMILFVVASVGSEYARESKIYVAKTLPSSLDSSNPDPWTENTTMWTSNANVSNNNQNYTLQSSIQFNITNGVDIQMELNNVGPIDCADTNGYKNLTFKMEWIHPAAKTPQSAKLYLNCTDPADYFYRDLTDEVGLAGNGTWGNLSWTVGPDAAGWLNSSSQTSWNNITGLKMDLSWAEADRADLTVLVDELFFVSKNFEPLTGLLASSMGLFVASTVVDYAFNFTIFSMALYVVAKMFHVQAQIKTFFVIVGYALVGMLIMKVLFSIFYLVMPTLYLSLDAVTPAYALENLLLFNFYTTIFLPIWPMIISAIAVHVGFDLPWNKSVIIAVIGFSPYYILRLLTSF